MGAAHLTLDAVACKAGVSKGGLIHNFPTKDALLEAMVVRLLAAWKDRYEQAAAAAGRATGPEGAGGGFTPASGLAAGWGVAPARAPAPVALAPSTL